MQCTACTTARGSPNWLGPQKKKSGLSSSGAQLVKDTVSSLQRLRSDKKRKEGKRKEGGREGGRKKERKKGRNDKLVAEISRPQKKMLSCSQA